MDKKEKLLITYEKKIQKLLKEWLKEIKKENRENRGK